VASEPEARSQKPEARSQGRRDAGSDTVSELAPLSLATDVEELLARAWVSRLANWPAEITASLPVDTLPVSVTGRACALGCAHCGGHYLGGMKTLDEARRSAAPSFLVSGGCDERGRVPVSQHLEALGALLAGRRGNWHLGLVEDEELGKLRPLLDVVSFDFVGDDGTLREVYGLTASADDYERCFARLAAQVPVVPHVTIGLRGGKIGHEWAALERLSRYPLTSLVLLVLIPTPGTRYAEVEPPPLPEVACLLAEARLRFPRTSVQLGCMRPRGAYREALDVLAVRAGLNVMVNPTRAAYAAARERGLEWRTHYECCVFAPRPIAGS